MNFKTRSSRRWIFSRPELWVLVLAVAVWAFPATDLVAADKPKAVIGKLRKQCFDILEKAAKNENAFIRSAAARAAGESKDPALIPLLKKLARDVYPTARLFALQALRKISIAEALALAGSLKDDRDIWVRGEALKMLGELGGEKAGEKIRPSLKAPDAPVRLAAAFALIKLGEKDLLPVLLDVLKRNDPIKKYQVIGYLGEIGSETTLIHLRQSLDSSENEIIFYALKAIGDRAHPELFSRLNELLQHDNPSVRYQAVLVMGYLPGEVPLGRVKELCEDKDAMVAVSAAVAANRMGSDACREVFADSLKNPDYGIRSTTARVLGEIAIPNRPDLLARALEDSNTRVRTAAVRGVGMMGGPEAFPLLINMLDDPKEVIRVYAAGNLIQLTR